MSDITVYRYRNKQLFSSSNNQGLGQGLCQGLSGGLYYSYFSLFILHLSRVKINIQTILHNDSRLRPRLRPWLRPWQGLTNKQNTQSIVYSFWVCFRQLSGVFTKVSSKVSAEVSAGDYTIRILVFLFFIFQE